MKTLSCIAVLLLAMVGLASLFRALLLLLFARKDDCTVMYITHIKPDCENVEMVLRGALAKRRWLSGGESVVCLDCRVDEQTRRVCESVCREYGCAKLISKEEFLKSLD